jgi:septal ring factor EnvC (AmiA/AmiB activator)
MFDHGAAQAASRLLPLLAGSGPAAAPAKPSVDEEAALALLASLEKERNTMRADLDLCKEQLRSHEERLVKLREALTRTLADHDGIQRNLKQLTDRNRLLTAGLVILSMLMIAGVVLFEVSVHHA